MNLTELDTIHPFTEVNQYLGPCIMFDTCMIAPVSHALVILQELQKAVYHGGYKD